MATSCNCVAAAMRSLRPAAAMRLPLRSPPCRTFTSFHHSNLQRSSRTIWRQESARLSGSQRGTQQVQNLANGLRGQSRPFSSSTPRQKLKTIQQVKARNKGGPFNLTAAVLFIATAGALYAYFTYEKERMARKRIAEQTKGIGKPKVGGPFDLIDHNGNRFTSDDMMGKYALVYFGFSHCPDICPDELDKMALMYDKVVEKCGRVLLPIMITCDPARDTPEVLKEYLKEFHPDIIGLTGPYEKIKDVCKAYRVYFSTPPNVKPGQDYLVDHSIYFYLMDPEGDFVEAIGRNFTADQAAKVISDHIKDWEGPLKKKDRWA
ncbi:mitochondrial metallochaperone Sco1 [Westerdykella ornata]|uniref:Mitochondrial metallochaperone Sco1 n=1 Tax=Westerdykella ornata TaxID=318751 RepID=A0A6A6JEQ5_WESOR|nr:mitochondrial metallochaperone Sco1 [Westerdykella ornata]KAF2273659.1 mitochondrial metallochaperone Sco1 [Westerdykella ornata]